MSEQRYMRIHLLVKDPSGPIHSAPGGTTFKLGTLSDWRAACDSSIRMGDWDRGTTEPWAVRCNACKATAEFKKIDRPHPREQARADLQTEPEPQAQQKSAGATTGVQVGKSGGCC